MDGSVQRLVKGVAFSGLVLDGDCERLRCRGCCERVRREQLRVAPLGPRLGGEERGPGGDREAGKNGGEGPGAL